MRRNLLKTGKPREVEGVLDLYLIRPGGLLIAALLRPTRVSPHAVSIAALVAGWVTAYYLYRTAAAGNDGSLTLMAAIALYVHSALDSADGQLARWREESTELGRLVDGISDYGTFVAIYLAIGFGLMSRGTVAAPATLVLMVAAGFSHAVQCAIVEYQRNLYRYYVYQTTLAAADSPTDNALRLRQDSGAGMGLFHRVHLLYARIQQLLGGSSMQLRRQIGDHLQAHPEDRPPVADLIATENHRRLRVWALLAPNSHKVGMIVGALPVMATPRFLSLGLTWYFLYVVVALNLLMVALIRAQTRSDVHTWRSLSDSTEGTGA